MYADTPASQTPSQTRPPRPRPRLSLPRSSCYLPVCPHLCLHPRLPSPSSPLLSSPSSSHHTTLPPFVPLSPAQLPPIDAQLPAYLKATLHRSTLRTRHYSSTRRSLLVSACKRIAPLPHLAARD
ncbi:hypothetical protein GGP41_007429 [Bipolaris sorokiniana]|uniref:Uncharacterized protein n=1 Tax=Cochliobolus sativus TaxID=45130 RepID=A0A8H5ZUP4_COCSA|nr:hypothetical protein GGP41_007429 [Bipolaris sorokiniana]